MNRPQFQARTQKTAADRRTHTHTTFFYLSNYHRSPVTPYYPPSFLTLSFISSSQSPQRPGKRCLAQYSTVFSSRLPRAPLHYTGMGRRVTGMDAWMAEDEWMEAGAGSSVTCQYVHASSSSIDSSVCVCVCCLLGQSADAAVTGFHVNLA